MKYFLQFIALVLGLAACGGPETTGEEMPQDLEGKRQLLQTKRAELKELTNQITTLENDIAELDPNFRAKQGRLVTTIPVQRTDFAHFVEIQGAVEADDLTDVTSEIAGRILTLKFDEGDAISKGQLVATLDPGAA
jgi:membrane fusion protein (multidrug efflux system)